MTFKIKIGPFRSNFVLRHRWEKDRSISNYTVWDMRRRFKLGIWFERSKAVGPIRKGINREETVNRTFTKSNYVNTYMFGMDLIVCKCWIDFSFKPKMVV